MRLEEIGLIGDGRFTAHVARKTMDEALRTRSPLGLLAAFEASPAWKGVP